MEWWRVVSCWMVAVHRRMTHGNVSISKVDRGKVWQCCTMYCRTMCRFPCPPRHSRSALEASNRVGHVKESWRETDPLYNCPRWCRCLLQMVIVVLQGLFFMYCRRSHVALPLPTWGLQRDPMRSATGVALLLPTWGLQRDPVRSAIGVVLLLPTWGLQRVTRAVSNRSSFTWSTLST